MRPHALVVLALLTLALAARADSVAVGVDHRIQEIEECMGRNLPRRSGRIAFAVEVIDRMGETTASRAEFLWHRSAEGAERVVLRVSDPAETAGTSLLMVEKQQGDPDFFVFLPEIAKVKQVHGRRLRGPVLGTDFSYEDLKRLGRGVGQATLRLLDTETTPEGASWVVEARPDAEDRSEYDRIVVRIDRERCLPTRFEFFADGERLRKVLTSPIGHFQEHDEHWLPHRFEMHDPQSGTRTLVRIEQVELDAPLSDADFTSSALLTAGRSLSGR